MKWYYCLVISYQLGNGCLVQTMMGQSQVASPLFTHSLIQFIYSFYKNYLLGSDLGTREIKQGAKQGSLSTFPSLQVRISLTPYSGLRAPKGTLEEAVRLSRFSQELAQNHFLQPGCNIREDYIPLHRDGITNRRCGSLYFLIF